MAAESQESQKSDGQNIYDRIRSEKAPLTEFTITGAGKEATLDEARAEISRNPVCWNFN